ncbi:MAG: amidohydrolase [Planctomycetia bacterium]|nr:amidohydrolase [Planctomycetia bacterium]
MTTLKPTAACLLAFLFTLICPSALRAQTADLVLRGGKIATCDQRDRIAQAVAIRAGRIVAVGSDAEIELLIGSMTHIIDLKGKLVVPGFIEGHGHFISLGETKLGLDLSQAKSYAEVVKLVAEAAKKARPGQWIIGRGWHQEKWTDPPAADGSRYPTHDALSRATPENPVLLTHGSGHMSLANARAMAEAGISRDTKPPAGGEILRDAGGNPTGVFRETAQSRLQGAHARSRERLSPEEIDAEFQAAVEAAGRECLSKGITSFQDAGSSPGTVARFRKLADQGKLPVRLYVMLRGSAGQLEDQLASLRTIDYQDRLTVRAIKCMADGALGSHGAWLLEPYNDLPESTGLVVQPIDDIRRTAVLALAHDYQICTHAIGDRANREVLNLYESVLRGGAGNSESSTKDRRWRIEHAQHLSPDDIPRFKELGVIASMQGSHATSDGPFVVARLGEKRAREGAYAWRSLLDAGARVINGTDAPVEDLSPLLCYYSSVTRRMADGRAFFPQQRMTRREALRSYTIDAAYGAFEEGQKGSIEKGKLADLVVLSHDILSVKDEELPDAKVVLTILNGEIVYGGGRP